MASLSHSFVKKLVERLTRCHILTGRLKHEASLRFWPNEIAKRNHVVVSVIGRASDDGPHEFRLRVWESVK
jgi:hypothetical protein